MKTLLAPIACLTIALAILSPSELIARPPDADRPQSKRRPSGIEPASSPSPSMTAGASDDSKTVAKNEASLDAATTIMLGIMGILGVFTGLILLALSIVGLKKVVRHLEDRSRMTIVQHPPQQPRTDQAQQQTAAAHAPATASKGIAPKPETPPVQPWKMADGSMSSPDGIAWMRPAFRAAFANSDDSGPARVTVSGRDYSVEFVSIEGSRARLKVNGRDFELDLGALPEGNFPAAQVLAPYPVPVRPGPQAPQNLPAAAPAAQNPQTPAAASVQGATAVRAPIPGTVIEIKTRLGAAVSKGQEIFVLEAMKMENRILSPVDGTVREIRVSYKAAVRQGDVLALIGT